MGRTSRFFILGALVVCLALAGASLLAVSLRVPGEKGTDGAAPAPVAAVSPSVPSPAPVPETGADVPAVQPPAPASTLRFTASVSDFSLHKLGTGSGPTLLVVGGIQGDEPGGFSAAALLASHYTFQSGSVWVVPDLNFPSILQRSRGLFGDMNRKFAALPEKDPEYATVTRIKSVLTDGAVDLVLNLHDGSGFYSPTYQTPLRNPKRWGQCVIIDQEEVEAPRFRQLAHMAQEAERDVNRALIEPEHRYHIRNTQTRQGDKEMEKTLSYFVVCNGKPAFGIEASKEFSTEFRTYYHVLVIESFMRQMGIAFTRDFPLTPDGVMAALNSNLMVTAYNNKLVLPLDNARPTLNMVPFKKGEEPSPLASKPLLTLVRDKADDWRVAYGNRTLTRIKPLFVDFDDSLETVSMVLDGKAYTVKVGDMVSVQRSFVVDTPPEYRVNAIGAQKERDGSEAQVELVHADFMPRFSLDRNGAIYRVEIYRGAAFAGMVLVSFGAPPVQTDMPLTARTGVESELGF